MSVNKFLESANDMLESCNIRVRDIGVLILVDACLLSSSLPNRARLVLGAWHWLGRSSDSDSRVAMPLAI